MVKINKTSVLLSDKTKTCSNSCALKHDYGISSCHIQKLEDYIKKKTKTSRDAVS